MRILAFLTDPPGVAAILLNLDLPAKRPLNLPCVCRLLPISASLSVAASCRIPTSALALVQVRQLSSAQACSLGHSSLRQTSHLNFENKHGSTARIP